jgi:4-hydroxyphenylacetate 3-monooxygenase/anthranilate 3-monooxygenase (FAD)/4-hydroxyphenylacetate 3-monooxygenase
LLSTLGGGTQSPFSASFDEPDALCVFEDAVVPWERVLFYGDVARGNELWDVTGAREHTAHQGMVTSLAKAELMVGMAIALAEDSGVSEHLHVQEMLGEAIGYLELARGCVARAEAEAGPSPYDIWHPSLAALLALRYHFPTMYRRMIEIVQRIGGASLVIAPNPAEMPATDVERYFASPVGGSGVDRAALLRLAWEATGDGFGQRQLQFEMYNAGDPVRLAALQYARFPKARLANVVNRARSLVARYRVT